MFTKIKFKIIRLWKFLHHLLDFVVILILLCCNLFAFVDAHFINCHFANYQINILDSYFYTSVFDYGIKCVIDFKATLISNIMIWFNFSCFFVIGMTKMEAGASNPTKSG